MSIHEQVSATIVGDVITIVGADVELLKQALAIAMEYFDQHANNTQAFGKDIVAHFSDRADHLEDIRDALVDAEG